MSYIPTSIAWRDGHGIFATPKRVARCFLTRGARAGLQAGAARQAQRMWLDTPRLVLTLT